MPDPENTQNEMWKQFSERVDHYEMKLSSDQHDFIRTITSLDVDEMTAILGMFSGIARSTNPAGIAQYYAGFLTAMLSATHGLCPVCFKNHDEELLGVEEDPA